MRVGGSRAHDGDVEDVHVRGGGGADVGSQCTPNLGTSNNALPAPFVCPSWDGRGDGRCGTAPGFDRRRIGIVVVIVVVGARRSFCAGVTASRRRGGDCAHWLARRRVGGVGVGVLRRMDYFWC